MRVPVSDSWWGVISLVMATLALVSVMPAWRWVWSPELRPVPYEITAESFLTKLDSMIALYSTGDLIEEIPVVHPPPGDIYLTAQRFRFFPALELEKGRTYRLHVAAIDSVHGFTFPLAQADLLLVPGSATVVALTPGVIGCYAMQCSEYCGLGHNRMKGWVLVR